LIAVNFIYALILVQAALMLHLERNDTSLPPDENEERRRIFYCAYYLDRQIRSELTRWLRELPVDLRCQDLSDADSSRTQLSNFSLFAGQDGPVQLCLTAATTIAEISRKMQNYNQKAFLFESIAKKALNNSLYELTFAAKHSNFTFSMDDCMDDSTDEFTDEYTDEYIDDYMDE
ncbi:4440_t:CDS:2, partial [Racocetra fulgida]